MADQTSENALAVASSAAENQPQTASVPASEPQPSTNAPHEPTATNPTAGKVGLGEKIRRKISERFKRAGFRKGKGRPKKCRSCGGGPGGGCEDCNFTGFEPGEGDEPISQVNDGARLEVETAPESASVEIPIARGDSPAVDSGRASLFRRSVTSAARSLLKILTGIVRVYMDAAELDRDFSDRALKKCEPSSEALDRWSDSLDAVLKKHNVEPKHSEEIAFAVNSVELLTPFGVLLAELKGEIRRRKEREK